MFFLLRAIRGLCGYLSASSLVLGIPTSILSMVSSGPSKSGQTELLLTQIVILLVCGWLFFWLRGFINRLHSKRHGVPHPVLAEKRWAL